IRDLTVTGVQTSGLPICIRKGRPLTSDIFYSVCLQRWVTETLASNRIDRIFAFSSAMAGYVSGLSGYTRILDMVDIDSEKWRAYIGGAQCRGKMERLGRK